MYVRVFFCVGAALCRERSCEGPTPPVKEALPKSRKGLTVSEVNSESEQAQRV
jgi:hypothetical protein